MLRRLCIVIWTAPVAATCVFLMGVTTSLTSLFDSRGHIQHRVAAFWSRLFLACSGVKVNASGLDRVPRDGRLVLVANHLSMVDIPVLMAHLPVSFRFLAKSSLFRVPFIGWHLRRGGHIRVNRDHRWSAGRALGRVAKVLAGGVPVLVFAEGSRSRGEGLQEFKVGAAHVAIRAKAWLVPVGLAGTDKVMSKGSFFCRPGRVGLGVGDPIPTAGMTKQDSAYLTESLRARVSELIAKATAAAG